MIWDGIERRRFVRVKLSVKTDIRHGDQSMIAACAEDISEGGIKVTIDQELNVSSIVDLEIYLQREPIKCKGKIVRVNKIESQYLKHGVAFDVGIKFEEMSEEDRITIKNLVANLRRQKNS